MLQVANSREGGKIGRGENSVRQGLIQDLVAAQCAGACVCECASRGA